MSKVAEEDAFNELNIHRIQKQGTKPINLTTARSTKRAASFTSVVLERETTQCRPWSAQATSTTPSHSVNIFLEVKAMTMAPLDASLVRANIANTSVAAVAVFWLGQPPSPQLPGMDFSCTNRIPLDTERTTNGLQGTARKDCMYVERGIIRLAFTSALRR